MLKLVIEADDGQQTVVPMVRDEITIGRAEGNTIRLTERNVSRRHARLLRRGAEQIVIEDVAARYGVKVNGGRIEAPAALDVGDEVQIGDYLLSLQDDAVAPALKASGPQPILEHRRGRLVVISSNYAGSEVVLSEPEMTVGRGEHLARVAYDGGARAYRVEEAAGAVRVNGRSTVSMELRSGDILELGQIRYRYCEPGELWSFEIMMAHRAMEVASPPERSYGGLLLGVMMVALLITAALAWWVVSRDAEVPTPPRPRGEVPAPPTSAPGVAEEVVEGVIAQCATELDSSAYGAALVACRRALDAAPEDQRARALYEEALRENAFHANHVSARGLLEEGSCALALLELDKIDDPRSRVADEVEAAETRREAEACVEEQEEAQTTREAAERSEERSAKPREKEKPEEKPVPSKAEREARYEALMEQGLAAYRKNRFGEAIELYQGALRLKKGDLLALSRLALAYEKNGDVCEALEVNRSILPRVKGKRKQRTEKKIAQLASQC